MPNPTIVHPESMKIRHYLAIADFFIRVGQPEIYEVEPYVSEEYRPDAYMRLTGEPIVVEIQRSYISNKKMQEKVDGFKSTFNQGKHDAKTLWIVADFNFTVLCPPGFHIEKIPLSTEV